MTGRTSWGVRAPGSHAPQPELDPEEPSGAIREPAADRADEARGFRGEEDERLRYRMQSARERVTERLDSSPPDVTTEELQRAVESLARRVEANSAGDQGRTAGRERAPDRLDKRPVAARSGSDDFDDILDRDDPRRNARPDSRRQTRRETGSETRPAAGGDQPTDTRFDIRPDTRPDVREEPLGVLNRLEARLDSLNERVERSKNDRAVVADGADSAARTDMSRQFLALEQRIDALREVTEANSVSAVREDLSRLGRQVDNLAQDRGDLSEAINTVRDQLDRLHSTFRDRGEPESAALEAIEQRLSGLAGQVSRFELAPAALEAVERGYSHILERMVKIERMAEDAVPPEDLWDRIEAIRSQIERLPSRDTVTSLEDRLLELADRIDAAASTGPHDAGIVRLEGQLEKIAFSLADIGVRKDAEADDLNRRLGDVLKRLDRMEGQGKAIDFTPIEVRLSDIASRLDTRLRGPADQAVAAIEKRLEGLARAFDNQLDLTAAGVAPLERKLDDLTGLIRDAELTGRGPDMSVFEQRLDDLQARLGEISIEIRRSGGPDLQRRLDELAARLDAFQGGETHIDMQPVAARLDQLAEQISAIQPAAAPDLNPIQTRLDDLAAALIDTGGDEGEDPVAARLDQLAEQISAIQPAAAPDLGPIHTRLDDLAAALVDTGGDEGEDPVAAQLAEITALLNAERENDIDIGRVTALLEKLESAFDRGVEPDFVALADRMVLLNETLENAAELASLEDISDLRSEIATLRRELRSLSVTGGEDNEIIPVLQDLAERIDKLPREAPATLRDLEDQMGRIQLAIEQSAGQNTAIGQIGETLTAIQTTLDDTVRYGGLASEEALGDGQGANLLMQLGRALREDLGALRSEAAQAERRTQDSINALGGALASVTGRMAADETGTAAPSAMQPLPQPAAPEAPEAPATAMAFEPEPSESARPETTEAQIPAAEVPQADAVDSDELQAPEPVTEAEPRPTMTAPVLETDEDDAPVTSSIEQDVAAAEAVAQQRTRSETASLIAAIRGIQPQRDSEGDPDRPAESVALAEPSELEPATTPETTEPEMTEPVAAAEPDPEANYTVGAATLSGALPDTAVETESDADAGEPALTGTLDFTPDPQDAPATVQPQPTEPAQAPSTGSQSLLGRLTSSQLLKRATGGKSESFTPDLDDDEDPDALLEPGTDGPMMSDLDGAPSSDTAVMSGERPDDAASRPAGAASIENATPGTGFVLADDGEGDKVNDFLAAARRAARAAVVEAAEAERYAEENKPASPLARVMLVVSAQRKAILAGAVVLAVVFAAWQYLQSQDGVTAPQMAQIPQETPQETSPEATTPATPAMTPADVANNAGAGTAQAPAEMESAPGVAEPTSEVTFADPSPQPDQFRPREPGAGAGDPAAAAARFIASAQEGNRDSQFRAGLAYARGLGVKRDYVEAYKWLDVAALSGAPQAGARRDALAKVMTPGDVDQARAAATAWFITSAQEGNRDSQFRAGLAYARGIGVKQDYVEAYKWLDVAALSGAPQAGARRDALANVMTPGNVDKASAAAAAFQPKPGDRGAHVASRPGGDLRDEPAAPAIDLSLIPAAIGSEELRATAIAGNREAEFEVATRYADGRGVEQDFEQAVFWYTRAAEGGLAPAQYRLASIYEKGIGVRRNPRSAQEWYRRAAEAGNVKAMHNLAVLFAEGAVGKPDLTAAGIWFKRAAGQGVRDSQFNAGILYARGLGVKQDYIEAFKWFAIAAHSGDDQAKKRREAIAQAMSAERLAKARAAVEAFKPAPLDSAANVVPQPEGGWGEPTAAKDPAKVSFNSPNLIGRAQAQLTRLGFDPGPADGKLGPKTRQAVEAFQTTAGIAVTGRIDAALVQVLQSYQI